MLGGRFKCPPRLCDARSFPYVPYTLVPDGKFGAFKPGHTLGRVVEVGMSADASMLAITHWLPHVVAAGYEDEVVNLTIEVRQMGSTAYPSQPTHAMRVLAGTTRETP